MIRPCDTCGGSGTEPCVYQGMKIEECTDHGPCPACADMPWLGWAEFSDWVWSNFVILDGPEWYANHEPYKPDPSTVMRWCQTHEAAALRGEETCWPVSIATMDGLDVVTGCDIVLIERPTPLEGDE